MLLRHSYGLIHNPFKSEDSRKNQSLLLLLVLLIAAAGVAYSLNPTSDNTFNYIFFGTASTSAFLSSWYAIRSMLRLRKNGMNNHLKKLLRNRIFFQWLYDFASVLDEIIPIVFLIIGISWSPFKHEI